jgi:hypothetical protein
MPFWLRTVATSDENNVVMRPSQPLSLLILQPARLHRRS